MFASVYWNSAVPNINMVVDRVGCDCFDHRTIFRPKIIDVPSVNEWVKIEQMTYIWRRGFT